MEKQDPPPYTEQPMPQLPPQPPLPPQPLQPQVAVQAQATPQAQIRYVPAQTYQPYPAGPTQPPLYPPMQQPPGSSTVIIHTTLPQRVPVGRDPTFVRCPTCQNDVITRIDATPTGRTHLWAMVLCLIGCWPCVCVPYCMDSCKQSNHYCPVCNAFIGSRAA
ncbi:PREDICTED: lipopolysaccharide-induced tumor necrosis factor-alpha factor homolog [Drosophila arizonae]|uniref:Lipopolysaccharide-induced tumor necrosis factor-alpha factor homolog n=1 Tax=Drosophila arizonae TaxID=7263 RepID=A0ABM1PBL6_DROAR|nr:PREDICTED: lipopolysaccharide-induced tumor necrosis factor-alpha factor homolog [Drosophila arizonae]